MLVIELLLKGMLAGLMIAAPVGPVNVLCMSRTISKGWLAGLISGLGAATADAFYGAIAGFSITFVILFLLREENKIRFFGGILLLIIGAFYFLKKNEDLPKKECGRQKEDVDHSDYVSALVLCLTNPTTILSFLAVLATLGLEQHRQWWLTLILVGGIFAGSMLWWIVVTVIVNKLRDKFNANSMRWMNRLGGIAIALFGMVMLVLSRVGSK
jgi:threonine/homoserine/homoserine lactone efflux protein